MSEPPDGVLADVLPAAAAALGVMLEPAPGRAVPAWALPAAARVCVFLVDGLGERLLLERGGHGPRLRELLGEPVDGAPRVL